MRKRVAIPALVLLSAALLVGGWSLAFLFQSTAQREAAAGAPEARPVTSEVVRGTLEQTISARAAVARSVDEKIPIPHPDETAVVTKAPIASGSDVLAGTVLTEINGRPLFAFSGTFPFYRDLEPGMKGPDVAQLQAALGQAGYTLSADGSFGAQTVSALTNLYTAAGYSIPITSAAPIAATPDSGGSASKTIPPSPEVGSGAATSSLRVPRSELLVVSQTPAFAVSLPVVGTLITAETTVDLEHGQVVAVAQISSAVGSQLQPGMAVSLDDGRGGQTVAQVKSISDIAADPDVPSANADAEKAPSNKSAASDTLRLVISGVDDASLPTEWLRNDVLAVISVRLVAEDSLLVPAIAVVPAGSGHPRVYKRLPDGSFRSVEVDEVATLEGRSAVVALVSDQLKPGDVVKVG